MLNFLDGVALTVWFGDFGGDIYTGDQTTYEEKTKQIQEAISTERFEEDFWKIRRMILPREIKVKEYDLRKDRKLIVVPGFARYYNIAGQLALAKALGKKKILLGAEEKEAALTIGGACKELGFDMLAFLSCDLAEDQEFLSELKSFGCETDTETCKTYFDMPYVHVISASARMPESMVLPVTANYTEYPYPSLAGKFAAIYGTEIRKLVGEEPDCIAAAIHDGTEAVGLLKAYRGTTCRLVTVERTVAQEYHSGESLMTRSADKAERNTILCPELANWWRMAEVMRLGCDRLLTVQTDWLEDTDLTPNLARAVTLVYERTGCKKLMAVEESV